MVYQYKTQGVCAARIDVELDGNVIENVKFYGGCAGNLAAIPKLVKGMTVEKVEELLAGNQCGNRPTSCADQMVKACRAAYEASQAQ